MAASDYLLSSGAAIATAGAGYLGTDVDSGWYRRLKKPPFQPPGPAFGIAWTVLYTLIAVAAGRALSRAGRRGRRDLRVALGINLLLNVGWTWLFFRARRPGLATIEIVALQASCIDLARRALAVDRPAALLLAPYLAWVGFASVLSGDITRRNR